MMDSAKYNELISYKFIDDLLILLDHPAHVKDAVTGKYLNSNRAYFKLFGFNSVEQIIGSTVWDIDEFMKDNWGNNATSVEELELRAKHHGKPLISYNHTWLNSQGYVWIHNTKKIPLLNSNQQVSMILTIYEDITADQTLEILYRRYKDFYENKRRRITKFLTHVGIIDSFFEHPTESELMILIAKKNEDSNKEIANKLNISLKTVETHIYNLRQKSSDLRTVLVNMKIVKIKDVKDGKNVFKFK